MAASLAVLCRRGREGAVSLLCAVSYGEGEGRGRKSSMPLCQFCHDSDNP